MCAGVQHWWGRNSGSLMGVTAWCAWGGWSERGGLWSAERPGHGVQVDSVGHVQIPAASAEASLAQTLHLPTQ